MDLLICLLHPTTSPPAPRLLVERTATTSCQSIRQRPCEQSAYQEHATVRGEPPILIFRTPFVKMYTDLVIAEVEQEKRFYSCLLVFKPMFNGFFSKQQQMGIKRNGNK